MKGTFCNIAPLGAVPDRKPNSAKVQRTANRREREQRARDKIKAVKEQTIVSQENNEVSVKGKRTRDRAEMVKSG